MRALIAAVLVFAVVGAADAQVSARQGEQEQERVRFDSPMILDLPLTVANREFWGKGWVRSKNEIELRKYSCDGVAFLDFATNAKRQRDGIVKVTFNFTIATESGMDKLVSMRIAIMDGEREVAAGVRNNIDAEEGKLARGQVDISVREETLTKEPVRTLRITLKVVDNP